MANENQQNDVPPSDLPQPPVTDAGLGQRGASRRRFARAGAGATGVLLTLASHPGMACSINQGPSGWHSAQTARSKNMVVSHRASLPSSGRPPSEWCRHSGWPYSDQLQFGRLFKCNYLNTKLSSATLKSLLTFSSGVEKEKATIAALLVTALMNYKTGRSPFLSEEILQNIWTSYQRNGTYTPMAGVKPWNAITIYTYLTGTMD